ncbi:carbohydrate sulfotransferase 11-like [Bolinopsis microptera]|uniref:carbohydrate sulfotransferase 11-like n=1 Tax=Bolinopsis microptera TaxID=2820187 RepID=UPI00307A8C49
MPRICSPLRIIITISLIAVILIFSYSDSTTWDHSLNSLKTIHQPVIRLLDYNEYVKHEQQLSSDFVVETDALLDHVHTQCEKYGYSTNYATKRKYMPDAYTIAIPEYNMLYVSNPKTGSTSFKKFVLRLQGDETPYDEMLHVHRNPRAKFQDIPLVDDVTYKNITAKMYVVGFVRNPITRLISGFRNKVLRTEGGGYNKKIYQRVPADASDADRFKVFVDMLIRGVVNDHHFTPQWKKMHVCTFPYNLLGQTETTKDNIETMMRDTGIRGVEFPGSRSETGADSRSTLDEVEEFIAPLSSEEIAKINEFYKMDFAILGYAKMDNPKFPYIDLEQTF